MNSKSWRCFHCDEVFTDEAAAAEHFGKRVDATPLCCVSRDDLEKLQGELAAYREDDGPMHRQLANLRGEISDLTRKAEESGYAKGLRDGMLYNT